MNKVDLLLWLARRFLHLREAKDTPNGGLRVEAVQKWGGGSKGDSWCCWLVTMILDLYFVGESPIPRCGSCHEVYELCQKNGYLTRIALPGDLFFYLDANGHAHHIGFVTTQGPLTGLAGNTSEDGTSSNGTGCFEHGIAKPMSGDIAYARIPL